MTREALIEQIRNAPDNHPLSVIEWIPVGEGTPRKCKVDVELLKEIEWCIDVDCGSHMDYLCPVCANRKSIGHAPDCWLAKLIGEGE